MQRLILVFASLLFLFAADFGRAEVFRFKYRTGDTYRILSTVSEDVSVNGVFDHHTEIVNRIGVTVTTVVGDRARHEARYMLTEDLTAAGADQAWEWGEEYESIFTRDQYGKDTVSDRYFVPTVRDVPFFPEKSVPVGGVWAAQGEEVHDFRRDFNVGRPFKVPFTANYKYTGTETTDDNRTLHVITAQYTVEFTAPRPPAATRNTLTDYPTKYSGYSNQTILWDNDKGAIDHYYEDFRFVIETSAGNQFEIAGKAQAEVAYYTDAREEEVVEDVQTKIDLQGLQDVNVVASDRGLTLSLENLNFEPDSAVLRQGEQERLDKIADLLKTFPNNDLLVTGHAARAGTAAAQKDLSERRAKVIAEYLVSRGVLDAHRIFTRGLGAEKPIATNDTDEGRAQNRRVEITILDK